MEAGAKGYHQNLWLFTEGDEDYVTEVGTMNLFAAMINQNGEKELVTAPLDGTILPGVTRDSILSLARERLVAKGWKVSERRFTMREVKSAADEGRLIDVFGAGTAAVVSPVRHIGWNGEDIDCGLKEGSEAGEIAQKMKDWIEAIQYGEEEHPWRFVSGDTSPSKVSANPSFTVLKYFDFVGAYLSVCIEHGTKVGGKALLGLKVASVQRKRKLPIRRYRSSMSC